MNNILIIKRYQNDKQWFILNESGNSVCNRGLANVDAAIEWVNEHYPEANTKVVDLQEPTGKTPQPKHKDGCIQLG